MAETRRYLESDSDTHTHTPPSTCTLCFPFQLFDYFVDAVIVRPPLISSIYSPAMPEGHLGKFFADSFHLSRLEADMIWILMCPLRQSTNKMHATVSMTITSALLCVDLCSEPLDCDRLSRWMDGGTVRRAAGGILDNLDGKYFSFYPFECFLSSTKENDTIR